MTEKPVGFTSTYFDWRRLLCLSTDLSEKWFQLFLTQLNRNQTILHTCAAGTFIFY